jgi:hypothetical protein
MCADATAAAPYTLGTTWTSSWQRVFGETKSPADAGSATVYCVVADSPLAWVDYVYLNGSAARF